MIPSMKHTQHQGSRVMNLGLLLFWMGIAPVLSAPAVPFTPVDDSEIIEHLSRSPLTLAENQLRVQLHSASVGPTDVGSALQVAGVLVREARAVGDPRLLGQADAVLQPWWDATNSPAELLVLKATIQQGRHEFGPALVALDGALRRDPRSVGAWLTKATILTVRGEFPEARRACLVLSRLADPMTALVATASVTGINGSPGVALDAIEIQLAQGGRRMAVETLVWAETVAAELAERAGKDESAAKHFDYALRLSPTDPYVLSTWADFQVSRGNTREVIERLRGKTRSDAVLLRYAEALSLESRPALQDERARAISELGERIEATRRRGSRVHLREEARYELHLRKNVVKALSLAAANWEVQREPVDWRLWIESARAAGDRDSEAQALKWASANHYEDVRWGATPGANLSVATPVSSQPTAP
jgi:Tfp pilus assembly protein PilF